MEKGFKGVYYNKEEKKIYYKFFGQNEWKKTTYNHYYYIKDPRAKDYKYTDLNGTPLKRVDGFPDVDYLKSARIQTFENNVRPENKFLSDYFEGQILEPNMDEFNVCYLDIELGSHDTDPNFLGFPDISLAEMQVNLITFYSSKNKKFYTFGLQKEGDLNEDADFKEKAKEIIKENSTEFEYFCFRNEKALFEKFIEEWRNQNFDIITGWNVQGFDMIYLIQRMKRLFSSLDSKNPYASCDDSFFTKISPLDIVVEKQVKSIYNTEKKDTVFEIAGIEILDYMKLYKKFDLKPKPSLSLQYAGETELGRGKLELDGSINEIWKTEWKKFVLYNMEDVNLVIDLDKKFKFIMLSVLLGFEARSSFEKSLMASVAITGDIMEFMHSVKKMALPDKTYGVHTKDWWWEEKMYIVEDEFGNREYQNCKEDMTDFDEKSLKGAVTLATPGIYKWLMANDVNSSYPHQIMTYNLSPEVKRTIHQLEFEINKSYDGISRDTIKRAWEKYIASHSDEKKKMRLKPEDFVEDINRKYPDLLHPVHKNYIKTPLNGIYTLRHKKGIMTELVELRFNDRKKFKANMKAAKTPNEEIMWNCFQNARKTKINSMYGVYALGAFVFHDIDMARAITRGGRNTVRTLGKGIEKWLRESFVPQMTKIKNKDPYEVAKIITAKSLWPLTDTDSVFICLSQIKEAFWPEMEGIEFMKMMEKKYIQPAYNKILENKAKRENVSQLFRFDCEKYISTMIICAKKQYITELAMYDGKFFEKPKLSYTGISLKRTDSSQLLKDEGENIVKKIIEGAPRNVLQNYLCDVYDKMKKSPYEYIARRIGIGTGEVAETTDEIVPMALKGETLQLKAAKNFNWLVDHFKENLKKLSSGDKIKYIPLANNEYKFDNIGWSGQCPENFFKRIGLIPDYDSLWESSLGSSITRIMTAAGYLNPGERITYIRSKFGAKK